MGRTALHALRAASPEVARLLNDKCERDQGDEEPDSEPDLTPYANKLYFGIPHPPATHGMP